MREWKKNNKDKIMEWKAANPDRVQLWKKREYKKNIVRYQESNKNYKFNNYERVLLGCAKYSSKKKNLPFDLELSDIIIPDVCPVLGIKIVIPTIRAGKGRGGFPARLNNPTLDRFDNSKGYTKDNIRVISWRANRLKCDGSITEFEAIVAYMKNHTGEGW